MHDMIKKLSRGLLTTLLAAALYPMNTMAQAPATDPSLKMPTLEDLIPGGETYRYTENLYGVQWWGDRCIKPEIDSLFAINPKNGQETLLTTRAKVNEVLRSLITPTDSQAQSRDEVMHFYNTEFPWADKCSSKAQRDTLFTTSRRMSSSPPIPRPQRPEASTLTSHPKAGTWPIPSRTTSMWTTNR